MAGMRILQALAAAGRARSAAVATGRLRCLLPRQPLGAHQALLGLGPRAVVWPPSLVPPPFSTNAGDGEGEGAGEGEGGAVAGGKGASAIGGRFKIADADATAQKTKAYAFHPLGIGNTARPAGELINIGAGTGNMKAEQGPGKSIISIGEVDIKVTSFGEKGGEGVRGEVIGAGTGNMMAEVAFGAGKCLYDEASIMAFMEKFIAEKTVESVPGLTEALECERAKHREERLYSDRRHLVFTVLGAVLELMVLALLEFYLLTQMEENEKKKNNEKALDGEKKVSPLN